MDLISQGIRQGARLAAGGNTVGDTATATATTATAFTTGLFVQPTIFVDVTDDMNIAREVCT